MTDGIDNDNRLARWRGRMTVVARFGDPLEAERANRSLNLMFRDLSAEVEDVFARNGGAIHVFEIAKIFALRGLRNDSGWEQDAPAIASGRDVAWILPAGAHHEDAETVMRQLGAEAVTSFRQPERDEDWRAAPHPMAIPIAEEDEHVSRDQDEEDQVSTAAQKPTLH